MAYGKAYTYSYDTRLGQTVEVALLKDGYTGSVQEMRLGSPPINRQASKSESDELEPLRPQVLEVNLTADQDAVVDDVYSTDDPWRVEVLLDGSIDFQGPVRKPLRDEPDDKFATEHNVLHANCGLGVLQNIRFFNQAVTPSDNYLSRLPKAEWILEILAKVSGLDVAFAGEFWAPHMGGTGDPWSQEYVTPARFQEDGEWMWCFDVLEDLVAEKGAFLTQERGLWHCYQRQLFRQDSFTRWVYSSGLRYNSPGSNPTSESYDASRTAGDPGYTDREKGGRRSGRPSYPAVHVEYDHGTIENLLPDHDDDWDLDSGLTNASYILRGVRWDPVVQDDGTSVEQQLSKRAMMPDGVYVSGAWQFRLTQEFYMRIFDAATDEQPYDLLAYTKLHLQGDGGTDYYLRRPVSADPDDASRYVYDSPQWTQDSSDWVAWILPWEESSDTIEFTESLTVPALPADARLFVSMANAIDPRPGAFSDDTAKFFEASTPDMVPTNLGDRQQSSRVFKAENANASDGEPYEVTVMHGSGPTSAHDAATWTEGGFFGTLTTITDWDDAPMASGDQGRDAAELLALVLLYQLAPENRRVLEGTYLEDRVKGSLTKAIVRGSRRYLPVSMEWHYRDAERTLTAPELGYDDTMPVSETIEKGETSEGGGSTTGGSSVGGSAQRWEDITGKPSGIFSRSGGSDTIVPTKTDIVASLGFDPIDPAGDAMTGALAFADDGQIQGDGSGAVELLADDGSNTGVFRVDRAIVNTLEVAEEIDQQNVNDLRVSDQYVIVNEGQTGTPSFDGGLKAERGGSTDATVVGWDEGTDDIFTEVSSGRQTILHEGNATDLIPTLIGLDDLQDVVLNHQSKYDAEDVLAGDENGHYTDKTISTVLGEAQVGDLGDVFDDSVEDGDLLMYVGSESRYEAVDFTEQIEERGRLTIGNIGLAGDGEFTESTNPPPSSHSKPDGHVWLQITDTDGDGVREVNRWVWDEPDSAWKSLATGIAGGILANQTVLTQHVGSQSLSVGNATINTSQIDSLTAGIVTVTNDSAQSTTKIKGTGIDTPSVQTEVFQAQDADILATLTVGDSSTSSPTIRIDGPNTRIESSNYASFVQGVRITPEFAEFGDGLFRGQLHSAVFKHQEVATVAGRQHVVTSTSLASEVSAGATTIEVKDAVLAAGQDIRFKEGTVSEVATIDSVNGTTITLSSGLTNGWKKGVAVLVWNAARITHDAQSEFAPFTSYVGSANTEIGRIGRVDGVAGLTGDGFVVGENQELRYSTGEGVLRLNGTGRLSRGSIGPFSIDKFGIAAPGMNLSGDQKELDFLSSSGSDLTAAITNPDFSNGTTGWTELGNADTGSDATGDYVYPGTQDVNDSNWYFHLEQQIDLSGHEADSVQFDLTAEQRHYTVTVRDAATSTELYNERSRAEGGTLTASVELPATDASQIVLQVLAYETVDEGAPQPTHPRLYGVELFKGDLQTRFSGAGLSLFDNTGKVTVEADRSNGTVRAQEVFTSLDGGHVISLQTQEIEFQIDSDTSSSENVGWIGFTPVSFNSLRQSNPRPPVPATTKVREFWEVDGSGTWSKKAIFSDGTIDTLYTK